MKSFGITNTLALTTTISLISQLNQINAFSPLPSSLILTKPITSDSGRSSINPLLGKPKIRKIERDWIYTGEDGDDYEASGKLKVKVFLPEEGKVKGCVFFMHGFSQYTKAYQGTLEEVANSANVAIISPDTGITSLIVLGELFSNPLALITDRNRAQFVLQRALSEDTKQCISMVMKGDAVFADLNIGKNIPMGVSGHSMGGGLSFPVAAAFSKINYVFTMAPFGGVDQFDPITQGIKKRTANNSMLLAGSWDLIAKADEIKNISKSSNEEKKDSSIFVESSRGLHTGFEDDLVITNIDLDTILGQFLTLSFFTERIIVPFLAFLRTNTGQLDGSEELMKFFFEKMVKGQKVTAKAADQHLEENLKPRWYKSFNITKV